LLNLLLMFPPLLLQNVSFLNNLSHTTNIVFFPVTNSNLVIKSTIKCIYSFSSTSLVINFPTGTFILFFILWHKSHSSTYFPIFFVTFSYQSYYLTFSNIFTSGLSITTLVKLQIYSFLIKFWYLLFFSTSIL